MIGNGQLLTCWLIFFVKTTVLIQCFTKTLKKITSRNTLPSKAAITSEDKPIICASIAKRGIFYTTRLPEAAKKTTTIHTCR